MTVQVTRPPIGALAGSDPAADALSVLADMATATSWMSWGLCGESDPELWFPQIGESPKYAKAICAGCPIRQECLDYAIDHELQWGVWGGMTLLERRRYAARRRAYEAATPNERER